LEKVIDQAIIVMASILMLINIRICYDLCLTLWKKYELDIVWLAIMFGSFIGVGIGGIITVNILGVSIIYRILMLLTLVMAVIGTYNTLRGISK